MFPLFQVPFQILELCFARGCFIFFETHAGGLTKYVVAVAVTLSRTWSVVRCVRSNWRFSCQGRAQTFARTFPGCHGKRQKEGREQIAISTDIAVVRVFLVESQLYMQVFFVLAFRQ